MKVVILCGGKGTRIRGIDDDVPKPLIPIGKYPVLWHIMNTYAYYGHNEFILCLGYKGIAIKNYFLNYQTMVSDYASDYENDGKIEYDNLNIEIDWKITHAETGLESLTGSRIKKIEQYIGEDEAFLLTYGDGVSDININELISFHHDKARIMTVSGVRPPSRFGELNYDQNSIITEFNEKPQATEGRISGGFLFVSVKFLIILILKEMMKFWKPRLCKILLQIKKWRCIPTTGFGNAWIPIGIINC